MIKNNLETLLNSYLEQFRRIDSKSIGEYFSEFNKLLLDYRRDNPEKALNILNEYRKIRYERNSET